MCFSDPVPLLAATSPRLENEDYQVFIFSPFAFAHSQAHTMPCPPPDTLSASLIVFRRYQSLCFSAFPEPSFGGGANLLPLATNLFVYSIWCERANQSFTCGGTFARVCVKHDGGVACDTLLVCFWIPLLKHFSNLLVQAPNAVISLGECQAGLVLFAFNHI